MNAEQLLEGLKKDVEKNILFVRKEFEPLSREQLNWKPAPEKWSIAQCLDHLNGTDHLYLVRFRYVLMKGTKRLLSRDHYKPSLLGNFFIKSVSPFSGPLPVKAPQLYQPSQSEIDTDVIARFYKTQEILAGILERAKRYDLKKNKLNTPVTDIVKLRFGDAMIITVRHDQRHLQQAMRVKEDEKFPT